MSVLPCVSDAGLSSCIIPVQKYSAVYGGYFQGLVTDETKWRRLGIPRDKTDSVSEPYTGDGFPQTG
jgi:hypothetical protein